MIILDFSGRYSIEWPDYWNVETEAEKIRDYSMSYLYFESEGNAEIEHFLVRFWAGEEVENHEVACILFIGEVGFFKFLVQHLFIRKHNYA